MKVVITFDAENSSFIDNFDYQVEMILDQAETIITKGTENNLLLDLNGNVVGTVWMSTARRP